MNDPQRIVNALLENEPDISKVPGGRLVRIRTADGRIIRAAWNGYWTEEDGTHYHSVGYPLDDTFTTGYLHAGDELLDPVPSYEEWKAQQKNVRRWWPAGTEIGSS
jgi:hypothetical protein